MRPSLAVFVPTFRRPVKLVETLESLANQDITELFLIAVADNDATSCEGESAARSWAHLRGFSERLITLVVPDRGISQCRNAGLDAIINLYPSVAFVAMIDDDARAGPAWLRHLVDMQHKFNTELVGGPVIYDFPANSSDSLQSAPMFNVPKYKAGYVDRLRGSGNCLLATSLLQTMMPQPFDEEFGLSGSEDVDFFERCARLGAKSAWAPDALVFETVPPERFSRRWILIRAYSTAQSEVRIIFKYHRKLDACVILGLLIARGAIAGLIRLLAVLNRRIRFAGEIRIAQCLGRLAALLRKQNSLYW
jgi:GT2 family glycosyltransferase